MNAATDPTLAEVKRRTQPNARWARHGELILVKDADMHAPDGYLKPSLSASFLKNASPRRAGRALPGRHRRFAIGAMIEWLFAIPAAYQAIALAAVASRLRKSDPTPL